LWRAVTNKVNCQRIYENLLAGLTSTARKPDTFLC
jgi:hypothetical protein